MPLCLLEMFRFFAQFTKFLREGMPPCLIFVGYLLHIRLSLSTKAQQLSQSF